MKYLNWRSILIYIFVVLCLSFSPILFGPGISEPQPFVKFLNGNFQGVTSNQQPYTKAFSNLKFDSPLNFTTVPGQSRLIVGQRDGKVYWFNNIEQTTVKNLVVDLSNEVGVVWDGGFLGLSIHPSFGDMGKNYFYVYYTTKSSDTTLNSALPFSCGVERFHGNYLVLERFEVNPSTLTHIPGSRLTMIKMRMYNTTHRGGALEFGNDGFLYLSTGDQAAYRNAQEISDNLDGGVLRIDVDQDVSKSHSPIRRLGVNAGEADEFSGISYGIPSDNPFNNADGSVFEEYYSMGHRNPHRMTKDRTTGNFYIGEVGENRHEEINVLAPGKNYGWPLFEGNATFTTSCISSLYNNMTHQGPLVSFPRLDANSLIGGYVYRGSELPDLYGKYICADYGTGEEIWAVDIATGVYEILGNFAPENIISFGQDYQGELYFLKQGANVNLYKLTAPGVSYGAIPQLLSETGAFTDLENLTASPGFVPYELIDSFWSDGAFKKRWLAVPNDGLHDTPEEQISFSENGAWELPPGSVLIKHFDYPVDERNPYLTKKIETRFSIKGDDGIFYFLTYNWNESQTDALLQQVGLNEPIQIITSNGSIRQDTWRFPSNSECISCHNAASKGTLGLRTRYLNSDYDYAMELSGSSSGNQLVTLSHLGIIDQTINDSDISGFLTHTSINDALGSLEQKARSYLDLNCAYCHQPSTGNRADFDLRLINDLNETGLLTAGINQPISELGLQQKILVPGNASNSQLYHRTQSLGAGIMMPPLAKNKLDEKGIKLIEDWIDQMEAQVSCEAGGIDLTDPVGTGTITSRNDFMAAEDRFKAFDNRLSAGNFSKWLDAGGVPSVSDPSWIQIGFGSQRYVETLVVTSANDDYGRDPRDFRLLGSNGGGFVELGSWSGETFTERYQSRSFALASPGSYATYRFEVTGNEEGVSMTQLSELELLGCDVPVTGGVPVTGVSLSPGSISLAEGAVLQLAAAVEPAQATDRSVIWESGDVGVATVDANGLLTAAAAGSTTVTVRTVDGGFASTASVTVTQDDTGGIDCSGLLTDFTDPVGTGTITSRNDFMAAEDRFKAFDNRLSAGNFSKWLDAGGVPSVSDPSWIQIGFGSQRYVETLVVTSANDDYGRDPRDFRLLGSNGGGFVELGSWSGETFTERYQSRSFALASPGSYATYRFEVTGNEEGVSMTQLSELELLGCDVPVTGGVPVTGVSLSPGSISLAEGTVLQLAAAVEPAQATDRSVIWESGDVGVATVDANGLLTAAAAGSTTVTVRTVDGGFASTASVTVTQDDTGGIDCSGLLTDFTDPVGTGTITSRNDFMAAEDRFKAFDNRLSAGNFSKWLDAGGVPSVSDPSWIQIGFGSQRYVETLVVTSANDDYGRDPRDFRLLGSNGGGFVELGSWSGETFTERYQSRSFALASPGSYATYRFEVTGNEEGVSMTQLSELELLGCDVPVTGGVPVTGVSLSPGSISLAEGTVLQLAAAVEPAQATDRSVIWESGDVGVATVDANGLLTAAAAGSTTVTVRTVDGGFASTASVTVTQVSPSPFVILPLPDLVTLEGAAISFGLTVMGGDPTLPVSYSATGMPMGVTIDTATGLVSGTISAGASSGGVGSDGIYGVTITALRGTTSAQAFFEWRISVPSGVHYRINASGNAVSATDGGPDWSAGANINGAYQGGFYRVSAGRVGGNNIGIDYADRDASIPSWIDAATYGELFLNERWDMGLQPEMVYTFPVPAGRYRVNVFVMNYCACTDGVGERVFSLALEGAVVDTSIDLVGRYGHRSGGMMSYDVEVLDGELDLAFLHLTENPLVNAIEVMAIAESLTQVVAKSNLNDFDYKGVKLYPNPISTGSYLNILISEPSTYDFMNVQIFNAFGSEVLSKKYDGAYKGIRELLIDNRIASGVYIVQISLNERVIKTEKLIVR